MWKSHSLIYALICPFVVHALPSPLPRFTQMVVREALAAVPSGFTSLGPTPPGQLIELTIAMAPNDISGLEKRLFAVSTPGSKEYGMHLSMEELESFIKPSTSTTTKVNDWLDSHSLLSIVKPASPAGDSIRLTMPVSKANKLLGTVFTTFKQTQTGTLSIQAMQYSVPVELKNAIKAVEPTTSFPIQGYRPTVKAIYSATENNANGNLTNDAAPPSCDKQVTPSCLQQLYGIPTTPAVNAGNRIAVPGFVEQYANFEDLKTFLTKLRPDVNPSTTFDVQLIDGGKNPQDPASAGIEANLDIQYTVGIATGVPTTFISSGESTITGFINLANSLLSQQSPPQVLSVSYGFNEDQVSESSAKQLCDIFMQLGTRGTSVIIASGDGGVAGSRPDNTCTKFVPTFPASCPYVTSVGATKGTTETAAELSSGGFSNYFPKPLYQTASVDVYLATLGATNQGKFDPNGRGYPDVSAQGESIVIFNGGKGILIDGTSASAPIFASVIALLNDELISEGKTSLGFLNPFLYTIGQLGLNDITSGNNPSCNSDGFSAQTGWDPVTGLGTPNFAGLRTATRIWKLLG